MSLEIESIIFDGEAITTVLRTSDAKVSYTLTREAIAESAGKSNLFERAKAALISKLANAPAKAPKGGHHLQLVADDLASPPSCAA